MTVVEQVDDYVSPKGKHHTQWLCKCNCKENNFVLATTNNLRNKHQTSCGCLRKECMAKIGGIKIYEPAADLGLAAAIISSYTNKVIPHDYIFFGEIGLTGEVRAVSGIEKRINESVRLNFKNIVVPHGNKDAVEAGEWDKLVGVLNKSF